MTAYTPIWEPKLPRPLVAIASCISFAVLALPAHGQPIALSEPVDVGAALPMRAEPPDGNATELDEIRSDYAIAAGASTILVAWAEEPDAVVAAMLDEQGAVAVPPFVLRTGSILASTVRAAYVGDAYVVAANELVSGTVTVRLIRVDEGGTVLDDAEVGSSAGGLFDCPLASMAATQSGVAITCDRDAIHHFDVVTATALFGFHFPVNQGAGPAETHCVGNACVSAGSFVPPDDFTKNVALRSFDVASEPGEPVLLGYKDALGSRIAVVQTPAGVLAVSRSFQFPPGDIDGQSRERLHGYFSTSGEVTSIDTIVERPLVRDPRLATNGQSIALAYRTNAGPVGLAALTTSGEPRGDEAEIAASPAKDVRLAVMPSGAYAVAYDDAIRLMVRTATLDDPTSGAGGLGGAAGSTGAGGHEAENDTSTDAGCACGVPAPEPPRGGALAAVVAALWLVRRRRR